MIQRRYITAVFVAVLFLIVPGVVAQVQADRQPSAPGDSVGAMDQVNQTVGSVVESESLQTVYPMSPERKAKLVQYSRFNHIWRFVSLFVGIGILILILTTGLSARLRTLAQKIPTKFFALAVFLALFMVVDYILNFPFDMYRNFLVESEFGFVNQSFWGWLGEDLLTLVLSIVLSLIPVWFFYWLVNRTPRWWLWFSLGAIPFTVLIIVIAPVFIQPLFNEFEPLRDQTLKTEILSVADRAGIENSDVFQVNASKQSNKINAYVTGLFGTKRIVLYDNMIENFTTDEIKFVMGHEMGHYVEHHMWWGLILAILFIGLALWITSRMIPRVIERHKRRFRFDRLGDIASFPLVLVFISILSFLFEPATNGFSRYIERRADRFGMDISNVSGESAAIAFDKLAVFNLSDPDPHPLIEFWFYDHPALNKRMEFVRGYQASQPDL